MRSFSRVSISPPHAAGFAASSVGHLGALPEWDLSDLYTSPGAPQIKADLDATAAEAKRMKAAYQGKLADLAEDGAKLAVVVKNYEKLADTMGKLGSYRRALLRTKPGRSRARQVLRRHLGSADAHSRPTDLLRARTQPDRRRGS